MSSSSHTKNEFYKSYRGCAKKISQKKSNIEPLTIEIPPYDIRKAQIDWEAFDRLKYSYKEHLCTLNKSDPTFSRSNSSGGSTDSLIEEANDFLHVAKTKLVTTQDWTHIQAKKSVRKRENKSHELDY